MFPIRLMTNTYILCALIENDFEDFQSRKLMRITI